MFVIIKIIIMETYMLTYLSLSIVSLFLDSSSTYALYFLSIGNAYCNIPLYYLLKNA